MWNQAGRLANGASEARFPGLENRADLGHPTLERGKRIGRGLETDAFGAVVVSLCDLFFRSGCFSARFESLFLPGVFVEAPVRQSAAIDYALLRLGLEVRVAQVG